MSRRGGSEWPMALASVLASCSHWPGLRLWFCRAVGRQKPATHICLADTIALYCPKPCVHPKYVLPRSLRRWFTGCATFHHLSRQLQDQPDLLNYRCPLSIHFHTPNSYLFQYQLGSPLHRAYTIYNNMHHLKTYRGLFCHPYRQQ